MPIGRTSGRPVSPVSTGSSRSCGSSGEVGVLSNPNVTSDTPPAFINGGVIYELTKSVDLDIGYRYGLTKPMVDYSISGAVTIRF